MIRLPVLKPIGPLFAARTDIQPSAPPRSEVAASDSVLPAHSLDGLLEDVERGAIRYFIEQRTANGLVLDRTAPKGKKNRMASLSATGFGLAAWVLAMDKGMLGRRQARQWVLQTLDTVEKMTRPEQKGWLAHFVDKDTGRIWPDTEISSIDTALFFLGAIAAAEAFGGAVRRKVEAMFNRVDFPAMLTQDGAHPEQKAFSLGFKLKWPMGYPSPAKRNEFYREYIPHRWEEYSEGILVPLLALGSTKHAVPASIWTEGWRRDKKWQADGHRTFVNLPLFTYFYPHAFLNLKDQVDAGGDNFWQASQAAVTLQQAYCRDKNYPEGFFGVTACDGPGGYQIYSAQEMTEDSGSEKRQWRFDDGTIAPAAILACLPFAEAQTRRLMGKLQMAGLLNTRYGASCGYNVNSGWQAPDAVGIDLGSMLLMLDAYRRGRIHQLTGQSKIIQRAMKRAGFGPAATS